MPMDMPPVNSNEKDALTVDFKSELANKAAAAEQRGDLAFDLSFDADSTRYLGEKDPLTPEQRQVVVAHAKSLRQGLSFDTAAEGEEWAAYWSFCALSKNDPEQAYEIALNSTNK